MEADLQEQVRFCNKEVQQDLDLLHEQVIQEVYDSVSQELTAVAQRLGGMHGEISTELQGLRSAVGQLQQESSWLRSAREQDLVTHKQQSLEAAQNAASKAAEELTGALKREAAVLRGEAKETVAAFSTDISELRAKLEQQAQETTQQSQGSEGRWAEKTEASQKRMQALVEELRGDAKAESTERARLQSAIEDGRAAAENSFAHLQEGLRGEAMVCEARFREAQAAVAELEARQKAALKEVLANASGKTEQNEIRVKYELETLKESVTKDLEDRINDQEVKLNQLGEKCQQELDFAHCAWARNLTWTADIDLESLKHAGTLDICSPDFTAAGLRPLRLQLRLSRQGSGGGGAIASNGHLESDGKAQKWECGAFLTAPAGRVSFRLSIAGRTQGFAAEFGEAGEWGSQKLVILERVPSKLSVTLEILDVTAPVAGSMPPALTASVQMTDAPQAASRETAALRSTMVKRIEWRIGRVSERLAQAKEAANNIGDEEALEPLCSPPFSAAGFDNLQLQLYPLGYRPRGEETCGFFLVCPKGLYIKCRAFIGDQVRNFEHQYDIREPYGRGSFCRLGDKADADDCVVVGIEFLEVREEKTTQVRGGPFGNIADQLKIVSNPSVGGMDIVRELRELPSVAGGASNALGPDKKVKSRQKPSAGKGIDLMRATAPASVLSQLSASRSLPSLLPQVPTFANSMSSNFPMPMSPEMKTAGKWK